MVDVAHDGDHRRARHRLGSVGLRVSSSRKASGSSSLAAIALWPISSTTIIAVSWSSCWLMVTIWPSFISCLMTSDALTDILCARSATRDRLGDVHFLRLELGRRRRSCSARRRCGRRGGRRAARASRRGRRRGAARRGLERALLGGVVGPARRELLRLDRLLVARLGGRRPARPAPGRAGLLVDRALDRFLGRLRPAWPLPASCATSTFFGAFIIARMAAASSSAALRRLARSAARCFSSFSSVAGLDDAQRRLGRLGAARFASRRPWRSARPWRRRCGRSPASARFGGRGGAAAAASAASLAAASRARASAASRSARSCSSRGAALLRQLFFLATQSLGLGVRLFLAAQQFGSRATRRAAGARRSGRAPASSRLTKVRFLRTSTWIVRALPLASACLISLVDLRVSVIFLRSPLATVPCAVRR